MNGSLILKLYSFMSLFIKNIVMGTIIIIVLLLLICICLLAIFNRLDQLDLYLKDQFKNIEKDLFLSNRSIMRDYHKK